MARPNYRRAILVKQSTAKGFHAKAVKTVQKY